MLKHLLRSFKKNKTYTFLNIIGLSLGMACCFLMLLYGWHEFNYDDFHQDADQIYRIEYSMGRPGGNMGRTPPALQPALADYFPEMEATTRFYPRSLSVELTESKRQFEVENVFFVDPSVVDVFSFDYLQGNADLALTKPEAVVLTESTAMQFFGHTNVVNETLTLAGEEGFRISAVVKDWPDNAHLDFKILLPFESVYKLEPAHARESARQFTESNWSATHSYTYVKLKPNADPKKVEARFADLLEERGEEQWKAFQTLSLMPVRNIHLHSDNGGPKPVANLKYIYLFLFTGFLTLFIAGINFVNLTTASVMTRTKNVVVRKLLGAKRSEIVGRFLGESVLLSFFAFLLAILLTILALPYFNNLTGSKISYSSLINPNIGILFFLTFLLSGILAGIYPAFFISRFKPQTYLKGISNSSSTAGNNWLRKGLITIQFLAAIGFIAGTITILSQLNYLQNKPYGFNSELLIDIPLNSGNNLIAALRPGDVALRGRMNAFDESVLKNPNIKAVTQCSRLPGLGTISYHISKADMPNPDNITTKVLSVDYDFSETFEMELAAGRDFDVSFGTDHLSAFMVNEKMMDLMDWEDPEDAIGKKIVVGRKEGQVIGVHKDFHFESLHQEVKPLVMEVNPGNFGHFALRIENKNIPQTLSFLEDKWKTAFPEKVFEYTFLEETINESYKVENQLATLIGYAAFLTIFISCFGLFGLAALLTQQRFREIGIRKVLGASVSQILTLIAKDFVLLIGVAFLIALPATWYLMSGWLLTFAYSIDFPWWSVLVSGLLVLFISLATILLQSLKAALSNPVEAIRPE